MLFQQVFQWWIVLFILGIIAFPLTSFFFSTFFDKGYAFAKTVGILFVSYLAFVLGTVRILPFTQLSLLIITGLIFIVSFVVSKRCSILHKNMRYWKIFLFEESIFFCCLFFWSYIKGFQPDIHGLEKFMDYGFINSILRSTYFPPKDMWMTPLSINYYYFGHLSAAVLTKLSFLPSNITFNLMLATLFASTFVGSFSLGGNFAYSLINKTKKVQVAKIIIAGLVTAFILTMAGNLHTLYTFFTPYQNDSPVPPTMLTFSPQTFPNQYWYPNATRFIYHTIHEFPIYSFVVSDLHGHVLDIPNVLLMIGLLFVVFLQDIKAYTKTKIIALGAISSIMYMTNAWDGLIYIGTSVFLLFFKFFNKKLSQAIFVKQFIFSSILLLISFIAVSLPFSLFFKPFASQIGFNCSPDFLLRIGNIGPLLFEKGFCQHSPLWQLTILYGFFFFWFVSLLVFFLKKRHKLQPVDVFVLSIGVLGLALIIIPEFVYLKDIYTTYFRANTMFKLVYQSFILLSLVNGFGIYRIFSDKTLFFTTPLKKFILYLYVIFSAFLIILVAIYPYFAITSYFNGLKDFKGLDGTTYLKNINSDDYHAIQWINKTIHGQPVLLEAQGDSYTDYERISSNTGLPTVFGWMVHEWLWRGTYSIVPWRIADVKILYESPSIKKTKQLLTKYHIMYVYIGNMERSKYPALNEKKFKQLGKVIYSSGSVEIYKIF